VKTRAKNLSTITNQFLYRAELRPQPGATLYFSAVGGRSFPAMLP
jgi:hypothetical protein